MIDVASRNVPINSATSAPTKGARLSGELNKLEGLTAATAFTVVVFVTFAVLTGFLAVDFLTAGAAFLVAIRIPPYVNMPLLYHNQKHVNMNAILGVMALFIRQDDNRSKLQERLAAELREKAKRTAEQNELPDGVTDSAYIKDTKVTTKLAWVWVLIAIGAIGVIIWLTILSTQG